MTSFCSTNATVTHMCTHGVYLLILLAYSCTCMYEDLTILLHCNRICVATELHEITRIHARWGCISQSAEIIAYHPVADSLLAGTQGEGRVNVKILYKCTGDV